MAKMKINRPILVDHVARIEGKAGIEVKISDDNVSMVKMNIFEGPRFFESITHGKNVEEAVAIFPRICSFCAAAHKVTAVMAAEKALGVEASQQTKKLRELLYLGDHIESHALHLFFLALPDLLGYHDALSMTKEYGDTVKTAIQLKDVGARIQTVIGARYIHQENAQIGGFGRVPTTSEMEGLNKVLEGARKGSELAAEVLLNFDNWKELNRERRHLALGSGNDGYTVLGDVIADDQGGSFDSVDYRKHILEHVVDHSFAKHSGYMKEGASSTEPFMTSALSRFTINSKAMKGRAREIALNNQNSLDPANPLSNNFAQAVELVHFIDRALGLSKEIVADLNREEARAPFKTGRAGKGVVVTEAPRGMLAYTIEVNKEGRVKNADIITPTAMFLPVMEADVRSEAQFMLDQGERNPDVIAPRLETVVRSYDPCVSCSVHVTQVR